MNPVEYVFRIDAFTPDTIPMARLAEYMAALAKLVGSIEHTHFVRVDSGSARLVHKVEAVDIPKVRDRLKEVAGGTGPKDAQVAYQRLDDLLANDNAVGELIEETGRVVLPFPGRTRPKALTFPAFRQNGSVDGQVVSIGGKDMTAHAILQDGEITYSNLSMKRDLARELGRLLYGPKIRLIGSGRWERHPDGSWKLLEFRVDHFEPLDERPLDEVLRDLRTLPNNGLVEEGAYHDVLALRSDDGMLH